MEEQTTPTEKQLTPLEARRLEVAQYEKNIATYKAILQTLPTEYPANLSQYKGATDKHKVAGEIESEKDVELLSKLWYADECYAAIRAETVELTKAKAILAVLQKTA